jgi:hypothetical protein
VILIFFCQNVRGLRTKCNDFIDSVLANNFKIYCITETWLNGSLLSHNLFPDPYCVFRADRNYSTSNTKRGGGVLTAVSKSFRGVKRDTIWKLLTSVYRLKFLSTTITVYSSVITIFHLIVI